MSYVCLCCQPCFVYLYVCLSIFSFVYKCFCGSLLKKEKKKYTYKKKLPPRLLKQYRPMFFFCIYVVYLSLCICTLCLYSYCFEKKKKTLPNTRIVNRRLMNTSTKRCHHENTSLPSLRRRRSHIALYFTLHLFPGTLALMVLAH